MEPRTGHRPRPLTAVIALLVLLPLLAGGILAGARVAGEPGGPAVADAAGAAGAPEGAARGAAGGAGAGGEGASAPAVPGGWTGTSSAAGVDVAALQTARGHVNAAAGQTGFLTMGLAQERDGINRLHDGSKELADGMILIQNGTRELGRGAQALADGVNATVGNISVAAVAAGQVDGAIDRTRESLRASNDPAAAGIIADLDSLQRQLDTVDFAALDGKLNELKTGVNDMATQLNSPNGDFRNGVWQATEGSRKLHEGLGELRDGHGRIEGMAATIDREVAAARTTAPAPTMAQLEAAGLAPSADDAGTAGGFAELGVSPAAAFLAAALAAVAGAALMLLPAGMRLGVRAAAVAAGAGRVSRTLLTAGGVVAVAAAALLGLLLAGETGPGAAAGADAAADAAGVPAGAIALAGGILVLAVAATAAATAAAVRLFGRAVGSVAVLLGLAAQVGVVGWVWRTALDGGEPVPAWMAVLSGVMPLHYPMTAFASLGSGGGAMAPGLLLAAAVLGAVLILGLLLAFAAGAGDRRELAAVAAGGAGAGYAEAEYAPAEHAPAEYEPAEYDAVDETEAADTAEFDAVEARANEADTADKADEADTAADADTADAPDAGTDPAPGRTDG
ncbi:hypothetical protein [Corynebacterium sp. 335C]